jgi:hypothetical protein
MKIPVKTWVRIVLLNAIALFLIYWATAFYVPLREYIILVLGVLILIANNFIREGIPCKRV